MNNNQEPSIDVVAAEKAVKGGFYIFIGMLILFGVAFFCGVFESCAEENLYPNFNSSHYIEIAQKKVKSKLNYPSTARFEFWEAQPYEENGNLYVMASGKVEAKNALGLELAYMCYVKFKVNLETNTYQVYEPIISDW